MTAPSHPSDADVGAIAKGLTEAQRRAFIAAKPHPDGEVYAYSVPDRFTKAYRIFGRGDPLNRVGLAVRKRIMESGNAG